MEKLGKILADTQPQAKNEGDVSRRYIPDDALCPVCSYVLPEHPDLERLAEVRGVDPRTIVCNCSQHEREETQRVARIVEFANLPLRRNGEPRTFSNFIPSESVGAALSAARVFASGEGPALLMLVGPVGVGKTHLLEAIGRYILAGGGTIRFDVVKDLLDRIKGTYSDQSQEETYEVLKEYRRVGTLLLDDIGYEKPSPWVMQEVTSLVDDRYRSGGRLVVSTNLLEAELEEQLGPRLASRLFDVNTGAVRVVYIAAPDWRRS